MSLKVVIAAYRPRENGGATLGLLTIRLPALGLEIRNVAVHQDSKRRWLELPAKTYRKHNGAIGLDYLATFYTGEAYQRFETATFEALDAYLKVQAGGVNHAECGVFRSTKQ